MTMGESREPSDTASVATDQTAHFAFFPVGLAFRREVQLLHFDGDGWTRSETGRLEIAGGRRLAFDGFFSCLYEQELLSIDLPEQMSLGLTVAGRGQVELWRRDSRGLARKVAARRISHEEPGFVRLDFEIDPELATKGRWYFILEAEQDSRLSLADAAWHTAARPGPPVRPEFVICTFGREKEVARNIALLLETLGRAEIDFRVTVVDNARSLERRSEWGDRVTLVPQKNLGGAGGFGRGILETLRTDRATHIVLMDDDAEIEPVSILRMINLFRLQSGAEVFLGGMQLDSLAPTHLADSGSWWWPEEFLKVNGRVEVQDLGIPASLDMLSVPFRTNFNGWWLMGGPIEGFRRLGLPLPVFVHLDDVEYSIRILQHGARLVTVPGIAIWHQPPYKRTENWFTYYDVRNELIRLSLQSQGRHKRRRVIRRVHRKYLEMVRSRQYGSARMVSLAVDHFLQGSDILYRRDAEQLHAEIVAIYREADGSREVAAPAQASGAAEMSGRQPWFSRRIARLTHFGHLLPDRFLKPDLAVVSLDTLVDLRPLYLRKRWGCLVAGSDDARMRIFPIDRGRYLDCMVKMARARLALWLGFSKSRRAWLAERDRLVSEEYWDTIKFD
jgi:galactofuranosylgalactofuranosylrhamnosyl-N-acetylglucosaminyl-diphospho-decaprenol beta-1,5/1,6-galactofuranosyltransferase